MSGSHPGPAPAKRVPGRLPPSPAAGGREAEVEIEEPSGPRIPQAPAGRPGSSSPAPGPMGSAGLRALLSDQPELLEPGLRVYRDEAGSAAGVSFATGVGEIDLLATDARGNLVAVLVAEKGRGEEELVGDVLQRIGWLRKHLCDGRQQVRAIVLVEEPPASLPYAAAAVADTVVFKTFRVALVFEDVEI